jgi:peptide/nickel transport system substrate-binding protein
VDDAGKGNATVGLAACGAVEPETTGAAETGRRGKRPWRRVWRFRALLSVALGLLGLTGVALAQEAGGTVRVARSSGSYTNNSNPFGAAGQNLPSTQVIYEPLFFLNTLNGDLTPLLGTEHAWSEDNLTLTVTTREGVLWHDGELFSAQDVAFTFNYLRMYPELDTTGLWSLGLESVEATDDSTVVFTFREPNTPLLRDIVTKLIVPEHIWAEIDDPVQATNQEPVGTGPFMLDSFAPQLIRTVKNPTYWLAGQPYVDGVTWQVTNSNQATLLLLLRNQADYAYTQIPNVQETFVSRSDEFSSWWPVNNSNFLFFNTLKAPFDDLAVRKAIAMAIDKADVAVKAYAGTEVGPAHPSGIIPAQQDEWLDPSLEAYVYDYDPEAARTILEEAGYTVQNGALHDPEGNRLPSFSILVGAGWTDFITMAQVISQNLAELGLSTTIQQENWGSYSRGLQSATYDLAISWGWGNGPTPYYFFHQSFAPEFSADAVGDLADSNFSRFTDPELTAALATFRASSDEAEQKAAITTAAKIFMQQLPMVPLTDRVQFSNFNSTVLTGWPSPEDPYTDGGPDDSTAGVLMFRQVHLK